MSGYLKMRQSNANNAKWKPRMWFVLKDRVLYAYKASEDAVAVETFPVLGYELDPCVVDEACFGLRHGHGGDAFVFNAADANAAQKWRLAVEGAVTLNYDDQEQDK